MQAENEKSSSVISEKVFAAIEALRTANPSFEHAHDTYVQQYGKDSIVLNELTSLSATIDPVVLVFGQTTSSLQFKDSVKQITGSLGSFEFRSGAYIIGRRQPQDSKLVLWNPIENSEIELGEYDARSSVIPSRIHGAFILSDGDVLYADLSSSSGTLIFGELREGGPFIRIYDPGSVSYPRFKVGRINTARKS